jgi:hypothetical protein
MQSAPVYNRCDHHSGCCRLEPAVRALCLPKLLYRQQPPPQPQQQPSVDGYTTLPPPALSEFRCAEWRGRRWRVPRFLAHLHTQYAPLVRGAHLNTSYVLLSDDITLASPRTRADGTQTLASQLALPGHAFYQNRRFPNARVYECANESDGVSRMMLSEAPGCVDSPGSRRMLITVLNSSLPMRMHMQGCAVDGGSGCGGSANGVTQHFVVMNATGGHWRLQLLLWPHRRGQLEPVITQTSSTFAIEWPGQADVWRLDSPYGAHPTGLLRNGATAQTARAFDKATARVNGVPYTQIRRPPSPPPPEPPPSPPFSPPSTPPSDGACFAEECVGSCPFRCQVFSGVVGSCVGAKSNRCSCPPALPWCVA